MFPHTSDELRDEAYRRYQAGEVAAAELLCRRLLEREPDRADAVYLLAVLAQDAGRKREAGGLFQQAAELSPGNAVFVNAHGESLLALGEQSQALACFRYAAEVNPAYARAHNNLGRALHAAGDLPAARTSFAEAVRLDPRYPTAHNNLGAVLQAQGCLDEAADHFREALALRPDYPEARFNLGAALHASGDPQSAAAYLREAVRLRPTYARAHAVLGQVLVDLGQVAASVECLQAAVRLQPQDIAARARLGEVLMLLGRSGEALAEFDRALASRPDDAECFAKRFRLKEQSCDWRDREAELPRLWADAEAAMNAGRPSPVHPLHAMSLPWSGRQLLSLARSHARPLRRPRARRPVGSAHNTGRLRVGYLSRDFYDHPVAHQLGGVFGLHERGRFEVHAYSFGPDDGSDHRRRIQRECEHFHDVAALSDADLAARIRSDGIELLVDLMGFTGLARTACLARRPAPVQVGWLGYPGSSGADFIDYLIGDATVTPPERAQEFSERLVLMPHSYMPTDHRQSIAPTPTRADCGLPAEGVVFCCFNNAYKIDPSIFDVWMRVMTQAPESVAWLAVRETAAQANLRREAEARGVYGGRLLFAGHVRSKARHLARLGAADLFLDTRWYNAHATACDALWAGLPVATCPGETFASRVGASLLSAVGLPELIAPDLAHYERLAVQLALDPAELRRVRESLRVRRLNAPLFDTPRFVRQLERAYQSMWDDYQSGPAELEAGRCRPPIWVPE